MLACSFMLFCPWQPNEAFHHHWSKDEVIKILANSAVYPTSQLGAPTPS